MNGPSSIRLVIYLLPLFILANPWTSLSAQSDVLQVATVERTPFVMPRGTGYIGYSIELWDAIASEIGAEYELHVFETFPEMLDAVKSEEMDLAVANITITAERETELDFSHPIYNSGLQIILPSARQGGMGRILQAIVASGILWVIGGALLILLIVAHLIWLFEWGDEREFHDSYLAGIWDSFWWAAVTVTTVGYGDKVPRSVPGRILALIWMFFGLFLISVFVAQISTIMANSTFLSDIENPADLPGRTVATVASSTADEYLTQNGAIVRRYKTPDAMFRAVETGAAEAAVFDAPVVAYYEAHDGQGRVKLVGRIFQPEQFGIALQRNSPHREAINLALLRLAESGRIQEIYDDWFSAIKKSAD